MEWTKITDYETPLPKSSERSCKVKVKLENGSETNAYFHSDKMQWIGFYGQKPCYFWDCNTQKPLFDVKEWRYLA